MRRAVMALVISSLAGAGVCWSVAPAIAESYVSAYGGGSFFSNPRVDNRGGPDLGRFDLKLNTVGIYGGKVGYWLDAFPYVGLEVDANHASPDVKRETRSIAGVPVPLGGTLRTTTLGFHTLARYPIGISKTFPYGQFQPYIGAGVGLIFGKLSLSGSGRGTLNRGPNAGQTGTITFSGRDSSDETPVPKILAGFKVFLLENLSGFVEYQYAHADLTFGSSIGELKTKFSSHTIAAGLSIHFDLFK